MIDTTPAQKAKELVIEYDGDFDEVYDYIESTRNEMTSQLRLLVPRDYTNNLLDTLTEEVKKLEETDKESA